MTREPRPYGYIYCITNKVNGKKYVGQTIRTISKRFQSHLDSRGDCPGIKGALNKYGRESFLVEELDRAGSQEELDAKERNWILELNTLSPGGYNLEAGGDTQWSVSEETRLRMRDAKKRALSPETIRRYQEMGRRNKGKKKSPQHVAAAAAALARAREANGGSFPSKNPCKRRGPNSKPRSDRGVKRGPRMKPVRFRFNLLENPQEPSQ